MRTTPTPEDQVVWDWICARLQRSVGMARASLHSETRGSSTDAHWRAVAVHLAHVTMGVPVVAVARICGRHQDSLYRNLRRVEAMRDDSVMSAVLDILEREIAQRFPGRV